MWTAIAINYIDRTVLSAATPYITKEFGISSAQMGIILSGFFWSYALNIWAMCIRFFMINYNSYFFITWLPTYLVKERGMNMLEMGFVASLPLLCSMPLALLSYRFSDNHLPMWRKIWNSWIYFEDNRTTFPTVMCGLATGVFQESRSRLVPGKGQRLPCRC
jgi:sugar phosphate permease